MTDKHIFYELNGERYKIPTEKKGDFERMAPTAKVMMTFKGENYGVPLTEVNSFVNSAGAKNVTYSEFDEKKKYSPDDSTLGYFEEVESPLADLEETEVAVAAEMPEVQTEVQEKPDSTFLQRFGESMMMSKGMPMNEAQPQKSEPVKADADIEDAIFSSHAEHKKSADDYIARVDAEYNASKSDEPAKGFLQRLGESFTRAQDEMSQGASSFKMEERREAVEKGRDYRDAKIAQNISDKVDDKIKQYQDPAKTFAGGVAQGFGDAVLDLDTWDSTIGANQAARVYEISKKLDKGESLTEGEQMIVDALVDDLASDMYLASGFGRGYKAGRVTGESLPFMLETMANPASGLGESITKKFGKEIFKQVSKKLGKTMAKAAVYGTRVAGDIAGASIMSATTSQPRVVADALDRLTGEVDFKINEDGTLGFDGFVGGEDSALKAYAKAFGSNAIEHYSEMIGNYFSPIGKMTKKGVANLADKIGAKKIKSLLTEMTPNGFGALLGDFAEQTQWHGTIGEFAEEMISGALNALVVGDQTLKKYDENGNLNQNYLFEKENMIDTFLGVAILGGVISTAKTLGYTTPEARFNKAISDAKAGLEGVVSEEEMRQLEAFASNPMGADYANLDPFFDKSREEGYKRAVGRYVAAIMEKQGYNIAKSADLSGTKQGMNELMNAYRVGQNMSEADLYDVTDAEAKAQQALVDSGFLNAAGEDGADIMQQTLGYSSYDLFTLADKLERDNGIILDDKQRTALKNLAVIKNAREGLENKLNGYTRMAIAANDAVSNGAAKDGILTVGFHDGKKVYVKGGVKVSNGSISKPSDITSYPVEIVDSMTGEATTVESGELSNVENIDLAVYNKNMADAITNAYNLRWEGWRNAKSAKSKLAEVEKFVGQKVFINTPDGKMAEVEVQQILPNGEVLIKGKKGDLGQQNIRVDADSFYDSMSRDADGNPIFNQSEFRSQSANIKAAQDKMYALGQQGRNVSSPTNTTPAVPVTEEAPATAPETEVEVTEEDDFRGLVTPILINGVPVEVEVVSQDGPSDTIVYEYEDENGNIKRGKTTIGGFKTAIQEAQNYKPEAPAVETPVAEDVPAEVVPEAPVAEDTPVEDTPLAPESIDWDALFNQDPEAYFVELQNQFGEETLDILNEEIEAAQSELDALAKAKTKSQNERFENRKKKASLQKRIEILNGMVARLTPAQDVVAETPVEAVPVEEAPETPADVTPEVPAEEPAQAEAPVTVQPEPQPVQAAPVAPNPVDNPVREAQKKEKALATQLMRYDLTHELKQDLAFKAGKAVADFFATREEYDAYAENATDLGDYYEYFERGVDESFANRPQNTGNSPVNSVPLGTEPKGENNEYSGGNADVGSGQHSDGVVRGTADGEGQGTDKANPKEEGSEAQGKDNKGKAGKKVADKYPARKGNATQKLLVDTFGFNKVEIPNSRKETLNTIYDFMMAMSKMLGISPKSIGQGGWLDVGSLRSNSQSSAEHSLLHKTIDQSIVKATLKYKYATLKGLAHEWWHALDHALSYFETGKGKVTASEIPASRFTGRQETWYAVNQVIKAIKDSGHESRMFTLKFPRRYVDYLVEPSEMAARAFEEYMKTKFAAAGIVIDNAVDTDYIAQPTAEEMAVITPAFDNLFNVLQEKEGKTPGTSVLFHIGEEMEEGSEAWRLATEAVLQALDNSGIDVTRVTDEQVARMLAIKEELYGIDWMTVYHGSGNKFDKFDHSHMGEGEGAQAHGWGTYVAVDSATSEAYAKQMGGGNQVLMNGNDVTDVARSLVYDPQSHVAYLISMLKSYGDGNKVREHILGSIEEEKAYIDFFKDSAEHKSGYEHSVAELEKLEKALELYDSNTWSIEERKSQLYTVEIPEDNGSNYLYETGYTDNQIEKIADACEKEGIDFLEVAAMASELSDKRDGARLYKSLAKVLGSDKEASEFLSRAGFAGIKYNGRVDGECFVIFNENDAKITGHTEFYQTTNGTVYGWTDGKKIYLTEAGLNPNTPIHEYTHLWARAMMQKNPKGWNSIKKLLKGTPAWNDVINDPNYRNISNDEDAVASEALSRISGSENAAKMEYMAQKMIDDAKGTGRRLEAVGLIQNMRDALNRFWEFVWKDLFGMTYFRNVEHVTDRILFDLLNNTDLGELSEGQVETQIVTDPKVIAELEASPKKTGYRNVVQNEDGSFSSPMAYWLQSTKGGAKTRVETAKFELGKWEEAEEHPELVDENGHVTLVKPNKSTVEVAYDPYIHNRLDPVNLQFKDAWKRDELVYVETEVPETDLESGYHADKALLPVGVHSWSNGDLILSKYDKPVRIMPWDAVADAWVARLNGEGVHFDVVPPALRQLLVERGVEILPPHKGMGKDCNDAYKQWKDSISNENSVYLPNISQAIESGVWDEAALNELNKITEDVEKGKAILKRYTSSELTGLLEGGSLLVRASIISRGSEGDVSSSRRRAESLEERARETIPALTSWAKEVGAWREYSERTEEEIAHSYITSGGEAQVFYLGDGKVEKIIGLDYFVDPQLAIDRIAIHNSLFEETLLKVTGFGTNKDGKFAIIVEQPTIIGKHTDNSEIDSYIESIGFNKVDDATRTFANEEIYLSDLHEENVLNQNHERYYVIDGDFRLNTPEAGIGGTRQIDDSIVRDKYDDLLFRSSDSPITPEMDAEYFAAVERGDMETAQRMVLEAAKLAMPNTKVVDEDGYPKVVYHGNTGRINEFDISAPKVNNTVGDPDGFYFTNDFGQAGNYSRASVKKIGGKFNVQSVFLNIANPVDATEAWKKNKKKPYDKRKTYSEIKRSVYGTFEPGVNDGYMITSNNNAWEYVAISPSQIKSAAPVTYDDKGNIIPLSERFNPDKSDIRYRKADAQNAVVDFLAGEPRLRVIENAVNEEAAKLGVSVTYKTREQMPKGHENDKGYYNTKTGEIVICTENATSIADAIQTILHEAVAHKGLRALMGDKFNEFINRVYESLDAETKVKVDALAAEHYDGNTAVATEEYIANLAETEDFANNSLWEKIKSIFEDIINAILDRNDIKIGDNELRYILRASYNNMVNPRGMESMRVWAQDQMMREEYKINQASPEILSRTGIDPDEIASETARQVYDYNVNRVWQEFQRQFQDAMQPVRVAIDAIQQATGNIPIEDYENYILIQNQSQSRGRDEIDIFRAKYYTPIYEQVNAVIDSIMQARGWRLKDRKKRSQVYAEVRQYLIAKHGLERNEYYQSTKTRKLTTGEKKKETEAVQKEYDERVNLINADTTLTDAERDLQLRDALDELNAAIEEINTREVPDLRDYSGLTSLFGMEPKKFREAEAEAQQLVDKFEAEAGTVTEEMWKKINAATDKTLRHSYESGMISRQQYNDIKAMFKFYIPLRGFDETTAEDVYSYARFEGNRFNPAVQTAKGRTSVADDPIAIIMNMAESEIAQGNKNRAKQALYNYLLNRAEGHQGQNSLMQIESVWYVKTVDVNGNEVFVIAAPDHENGETYEEFENRMQALAAEDKAYKSKKGHVDVGVRFQKQQNRNAHYVYLKVNGVDKAMYINGDPKAADAINGTYRPKPILEKGSIRTDSKILNKIIEIAEDDLSLQNINRLISSTFTNYSLEFTARNYFRDMFYSHINIGVREKDPAYRKKFRQNWRHNNLGTMMRMLKAYRAGEYENRPLNEDEAAFVEFMQNGGQTGYTIINSVESRKRELEKAIERMQKGLEKGGVKDSTIFKFTLGAIETLNEASELVTRFAAFKTSRDMGRGVVRAISDAKEVTVNFNTKGAQDGKGILGFIARYFGWAKFFFNASVQGVQNIKAMAEANKLKFGSVVGGMVATGFMMPILTSAVSEMLGGDDDEYWNIPEYDRQNNICIVIGNGKYVKLPLPIGFREMYGLGDMFAAMSFDKKFTRDFYHIGMDMANKVASVILPINPLESAANGLSFLEVLAYTAAPSSAQFVIQGMTNTDWKGAPLQKEYTYNEDDPQWMKAFKSNPSWMVGLSKWCNEHIGTVDYKGWDWSPEKLDNTLSNVFGGIYSLIKKTGRTISMAWDEEERNLSNVPLAGVIIGSGIDSDERRVDDGYFTEKEYYDDRIGSIKRVAKRFGYDLKDIFVEGEGRHNPKMIKDIYSKKDFDFMQEWYLGHEGNLDGDTEAEVKGLDRMRQDIKNLEKQINKYEDDIPQDLIDELIEKTNEFEAYRRELVEDLMELD